MARALVFLVAALAVLAVGASPLRRRLRKRLPRYWRGCTWTCSIEGMTRPHAAR